MKKIIKTKYFTIGLIVGLSLISVGAYAAPSLLPVPSNLVTGAGTLGSLFEKVGNAYRLIGDNIKDNTIDSSEIQDNTLTANDLAPNSVGSSELANNAVYTNAIQDKIVTKQKIADGVIPTKVSELANDEGYLTTLGDIKYLRNGKNRGLNKDMTTDVVVDDTLRVKRNLYVDGNIIGTTGIWYCNSSNVGKYQLTEDGYLKKCIEVPEDTKTINTGKMKGKYYYNLADNCKSSSSTINKLFSSKCSNGYYYRNTTCYEAYRYRDISTFNRTSHYGSFGIHCKRNAYYKFETK